MAERLEPSPGEIAKEIEAAQLTGVVWGDPIPRVKIEAEALTKRHGHFTVEQVADACGLTYEPARKTLYAMHRRGELEKGRATRGGRQVVVYRIPSPSPRG